jgi:hypothetical protein
MAIKKGFIDVVLSRFQYTSDAMGPQLRTQIVFSKHKLQKVITRPLLTKAAFVYGRGTHNLGVVRIYFINQGLALSAHGGSSDKTMVQNSFGSSGVYRKFYEAHLKDTRSVGLTAAVFYDDALDLFYIEIALMPAGYRTEIFQQAVNTLPNFGNPAWGYVAKFGGGKPMKLEVHKGSLSVPLPATKKSKTTGAKANFVAKEVREAIVAEVLGEHQVMPATKIVGGTVSTPSTEIQPVKVPHTTKVSYREGFLIIREADGSDLWIRKDRVDFDVFRVVNGRIQLDLAEGRQLLIDITPQDFLALAAD